MAPPFRYSCATKDDCEKINYWWFMGCHWGPWHKNRLQTGRMDGYRKEANSEENTQLKWEKQCSKLMSYPWAQKTLIKISVVVLDQLFKALPLQHLKRIITSSWFFSLWSKHFSFLSFIPCDPERMLPSRTVSLFCQLTPTLEAERARNSLARQSA